MPTVSAQQLRDIVAELIASTIEMHRVSRASTDQAYLPPSESDPTDDEIDDFLQSNPLLDGETVSQLTDPGLLGFFSKTAHATDEWIAEFREDVSSWAETQEWQAADLVYYHVLAMFDEPIPAREIWSPTENRVPFGSFAAQSPAHLLLAEKLLRQGRLLSELHWRDFEKLIAELLEHYGWDVTLMRGTKDGGIDVISQRKDPVLGPLRAVWQAKKYAEDRKVQLSHLRELSGIVDQTRATKGIIVTTSSLTRGAVQWVQRDTYRLDAKDGRFVEWWVRRRLSET